jgi:hypothetical protein
MLDVTSLERVSGDGSVYKKLYQPSNGSVEYVKTLKLSAQLAAFLLHTY